MTETTTPQGVQRRILGVLSLAQVVGGLGTGAGLAVGALLIEEISGSASLAGLAVTFMAVGAAALTVPLSNLAVKHGRRPALTLGWLLGGVGAALNVSAAIWNSVPLVLMGFTLFGVASAANLQSRFAAADRAEPGAIGTSISIVVWSTTIGAVTGPNLTGPGASIARLLSIPELAGPMVLSIGAFAGAALITWLFLRPDPLIANANRSATRPRVRDALPHLRGRAGVAVFAVAMSHAVMVAVMALTPVHMKSHDADLSIIGFTISLHIAGMYALSPVMGWLTDTVGAEKTILLGQAILALACLVAGLAGGSVLGITVGLTLLGLGWSAAVIAGATMLSTSVDSDVRPLVQGFSDLSMNAAGAVGGLLAGVIVWTWGFGSLTALSTLVLIPVVIAVVMLGRKDAQVVGGGPGSVPSP